MRPLQAIATGYRRSLQFSGRSGRPEYWGVATVSATAILVASAADHRLGLDLPRMVKGDSASGGAWQWLSLLMPPVRGPLSLAALALCAVPNLSAVVRRSRDAGRSAAVPLLAFVAPAVWMVAGPTALEFLTVILDTLDQHFGALVGVAVIVLAPLALVLPAALALAAAFTLFAAPSVGQHPRSHVTQQEHTR
jgi:uncharacterized membrane protein YhaH (DUF805 family)